MDNLPKITIYTDGACSGNPGVGGWGAILLYSTIDKNGKKQTLKKAISGREENTTNNKMEMMAVISSLKLLKKPCDIDLYTDSKYVMSGITEWIYNWIKNGWKGADKKPVKNKELWQEMFELTKLHQIHWHWVKGHADNELNNEVDKLAREQCGTI